MPNTAFISRLGLIGLLSLFAAGCDSKNDTQQPPSPQPPAPVSVRQGESIAVNNPAAKPSITFDTVLTCWQQNRKEDAAAAFLALDWKNTALFADHRCLTLSEKQFTALRRSEQEALAAQALEMSKSIKEMTRFFVEQAKTAAAANRLEDAAKYQTALMQFATGSAVTTSCCKFKLSA
jgi:hypothetical protein